MKLAEQVCALLSCSRSEQGDEDTHAKADEGCGAGVVWQRPKKAMFCCPRQACARLRASRVLPVPGGPASGGEDAVRCCGQRRGDGSGIFNSCYE